MIAYNCRAFFRTDLPFPSIADPLYLAVYPVSVAGLLLLLSVATRSRELGGARDDLYSE